MKIGIIGQGAWGTALGDVLLRNGITPFFFGRELDLKAVKECDAVILAVPAQSTRMVLMAAKESLDGIPLLITAKGIEQSSAFFQSEIVESITPHSAWTILSGPTFAQGVMEQLPCAAVLASRQEEHSKFWMPLLSHATFRLYLQSDYLGVQIGGAVKNVIAIASGLLTGLGGGENARAALLTRGLAEMVRFGVACGGQASTFMGLSGIGDLMLTATSPTSRNFSLGLSMAQGTLDHSKGVKEGALTASILIQKAREHHLSMPICEVIHQIVSHNISPKTALESLMLRPVQSE